MKKYNAVGAVEMGISVLVIVIISSILVFKYAPAGSSKEKRNQQRQEDIAQIMNGIEQYKNEFGGALPVGIPQGENCSDKENELCRSNASLCSDFIYIQDFTNSEKYIASIPVDPKSDSINGTGYNIVTNGSGVVTVCAPMAELGKNISISN